MKRKNEEQLIELAFGDVHPSEADRMRQEIAQDPNSQATLRAYEDLRSSIGCLRDVPEMQLSRERLRDAILAGGLKESKPIRWSWLGAPVAIAAVAFAFTMIVRRPDMPLPSGVAMSSASGDSEVLDMDPNLERYAASAPSLFGNKNLNEVDFRADNPTEKIVVASVTRPKTQRTPTFTPPTPEPPMASTPTAAADMAAGIAAPGAGEMTLTSAPPAESSEVIVLTTETDRETGAQRATAMESSSNVVIGG